MITPRAMPIYVMMSVSTLRPQFGQSGRFLRRKYLYLFCHSCKKTASADFFAAIARIGKFRALGGAEGPGARLYETAARGKGRGGFGLHRFSFDLRGDGGSDFRFCPWIGGDLRLGPWPTVGRAVTTFHFENDGLDEL
jgi:hypothetical protein